MIESHWKSEGERVVWSVTIPPNAVAEVSIPGKEIKGVKEDGVSYVRDDNDRQVYKVASGRYTFRFTKTASINRRILSKKERLIKNAARQKIKHSSNIKLKYQ
jgi:hypothetical protein